MKLIGLFATLACLLFGNTRVALAEEPSATARPEASVSPESVEACFPACRSGYVCHPEKRECVSICDPLCDARETCSKEAVCIKPGLVRRRERPRGGDRRLRLLLLGRFGLGPKLELAYTDPFSSSDGVVEETPRATLGFDLRVEKPVAKHLTVGGLVSNYWVRPERTSSGGSTPGFLKPNDYALDISPFVKPRYPFKIGSKEAEAYIVIHVGGSLRVLSVSDGVFLGSKTGVFGGFNWGVAPGIQIFITRHVGLVVEVGYAKTWIKIGTSILENTTVGQATVRFGLAFAFGE
jgi:hypothetical protein